MFHRIVKVTGSWDINPNEHLQLLMCEGTVSLMLPPVERCTGNSYCILPIRDARVVLKTSDQLTQIDAGAGPVSELEITGQNIYGLFATNRWIVTGLDNKR